MRTYQVELLIAGPVTVSRSLHFNADKELDIGHIFQSRVEIKKANGGLIISSTVHTADQDRAYKVALLFIGKMLDILSLRTNTALNLNIHEAKIVSERSLVKAVITPEDFRRCFELSRTLNLNEPKMLRSLNWYRKGLYTDDPFDKFLAFWNSIGVAAGWYHTPDTRTAAGSVNQIWNCFITLWGQECREWPVINGDVNWVNVNNNIRNDIAHGNITIEIDHVTNVLNRLDAVQTVAYNFLSQWALNQLNIEIFQ
jgi:hypothetical protein